MAEYCLQTTVGYGIGGSVSVTADDGSVCTTTGTGTDSICTTYYEGGSSHPIYALSSDGYEISRWQLRSGSFTGTLIDEDSSGHNPYMLTMPDSNAYLTLYYKQPDTNLTLSVNGGVGGCVSLKSPTGHVIPCEGGNLVIASGPVIVMATPSVGYEIQKWTLKTGTNAPVERTGVNAQDDEYIVTLSGSNTVVVVYFQAETVCPTYHLTIEVDRRGEVSPPSGDYCQYSEMSLTPSPSGGYKFKEWIYTSSDSDIVLNGITLNVRMGSDKTVKAVFEAVSIVDPGIVPESPNIFYCPSQEYQSHLVTFNYTNTDAENSLFHFRANFYSGSDMGTLVYSAFSLTDVKRWYYDDGAIRPIPIEGVSIPYNSTYRIIFDTEVIPSNITEQQRSYLINETEDFSEIPIVCGNRYYVSAERYNVLDSTIALVQNINLVVSCDIADGFYWSEDRDKNNWVCSGQGNADLKVSDSGDYSIHSAVSSNLFDLFGVVWQSHRGNSDSIYGAIWDSEDDILYSSGQGLFDKKYINDGKKPLIVTDPASNFYVSAQTKTDINFYACPLPISIPSEVTETEDSSFSRLCYPGESTYLGSSFGTLQARVYDEDVDSSLVINHDKVMPVVTKTNIRLDISGISGMYAIRLRASESQDWGEWLLVEDPINNIVKIDNSRFIVPFSLSRINGVRRICCRVLTLYGISKTFCIEVFLNKNAIDYSIKFYSDSARENESKFVYNGMYVVTGPENGADAYFRVTFSEALDDSTSNNLTFNVIQQGVDDIWDQPLVKVGATNTMFDGVFKVYKHDGVFSKDGKAFIQIVFPDSLSGSMCVSDITDAYNLVVSNKDASRYQNLSPEQVYNETISSQVGKAVDLIPFHQYYSVDDANFRFGDPDYMRKG
jgi:hypothetical protein